MVLERHYKGAAELIEQVGRKHPRHEVAVTTSSMRWLRRLLPEWLRDYRTLPENVETDQEGLRMEMVYTQ